MEVNFRSDHKVELVNFMGGDDSVVRSAKVSFNSDTEPVSDERREGLIRFLYENQHMSPFEHSVFTFLVETPLFVRSEFMRHRAASYSEISGRYSELPLDFYLPDPDRPLQQVGKAGNYSFIEGTYSQKRLVAGDIMRENTRAAKAYQGMLKAGVAKEAARMVLPVNTYSRFYATMSTRNLMHFLDLRTHPTALYEIRQVAGEMEEIFSNKMPITYKMWSNGRE